MILQMKSPFRSDLGVFRFSHRSFVGVLDFLRHGADWKNANPDGFDNWGKNPRREIRSAKWNSTSSRKGMPLRGIRERRSVTAHEAVPDGQNKP